MRVIAGTFRGRRLTAPKGKHLVRPTADRVKESVFSILREQVVGANFLDLCAGTGNMGIEALSRGAKHVTFLDRDPRCIAIIERNLNSLGLQAAKSCSASTVRYSLLCRDVREGIADLQKHGNAEFEVIYFDPPYGTGLGHNTEKSFGLYTDSLTLLAETALLKTDGTLLVEHAKQVAMPAAVGSLYRNRQKRYGDTIVSFYGRNV